MKKRLLAILICIALSSILCVSAFATEDIGIIGGADGDTEIILNDEDILYEDEFYDDYYDEYYYDDEFYSDDLSSDLSELEYVFEQFGEENVGVLIAAVVVMLICSLLFLPALILLIVFAVLNGKLKKKIREYELRNNGFAGVQYQPQPVNQPYAQPVPQPIAQPIVNTQPVAQPIINGEAVNPAQSNNEGGEA